MYLPGNDLQIKAIQYILMVDANVKISNFQ